MFVYLCIRVCRPDDDRGNAFIVCFYFVLLISIVTLPSSLKNVNYDVYYFRNFFQCNFKNVLCSAILRVIEPPLRVCKIVGSLLRMKEATALIYRTNFRLSFLNWVLFCVTTYLFNADKKNQLDVTFCILYFPSNSCSICFGQPCAHHQELTAE